MNRYHELPFKYQITTYIDTYTGTKEGILHPTRKTQKNRSMKKKRLRYDFSFRSSKQRVQYVTVVILNCFKMLLPTHLVGLIERSYSRQVCLFCIGLGRVGTFVFISVVNLPCIIFGSFLPSVISFRFETKPKKNRFMLEYSFRIFHGFGLI